MPSDRKRMSVDRQRHKQTARLARHLVRQLARQALRSRPTMILRMRGSLIRLMGDSRSELFHYEVRCSYDSQEIAESRRIVEQARQLSEQLNLSEGNEIETEEQEKDYR
jgi:hypothetical protein